MQRSEGRVGRILVVDDERSMRDFMEILLQRDNHEVVSCGSAAEAVLALESVDFDVVISDIRMPGMSGLELLDRVQQLAQDTLVILITAHGTTESAVDAMKRGAYDYLTKPCSVDEIRVVVDKALEKRSLASENLSLKRQLREQTSLPTMLGKSSRMRELFELVRQVGFMKRGTKKKVKMAAALTKPMATPLTPILLRKKSHITGMPMPRAKKPRATRKPQPRPLKLPLGQREPARRSG